VVSLSPPKEISKTPVDAALEAHRQHVAAMRRRRTPRVLFVLKRRPAEPDGDDCGYDSTTYSTHGSLDSGLLVSVLQMSRGLDEECIENYVAQVVDNNSIYKEINAFSPTHVVIEAFWVVPSKFDELMPMYPGVTWIVRNHSKSDFLSHEGGMIGWAIDYLRKGIILGCNSVRATQDFKNIARTFGYDEKLVVYLPNYYDTPKRPLGSSLLSVIANKLVHELLSETKRRPVIATKGVLNIGCFGAIRPLKNHLHQALAALMAADYLGLTLNFHVNVNRVEGGAAAILRALRVLFEHHENHKLVEVTWMRHAKFLRYIAAMDLVMQVSNSETFNIVAADSVSEGVPVLVSDEVPWLDKDYHADPSDTRNIAEKIVDTLAWSRSMAQDQLRQLVAYCNETKRLWKRFLEA
jgi:hypothetical protein